MLKLFCFLLAHFNSFFINICFSHSSVNAKKKFWSVSTFFTCVHFFGQYNTFFLYLLLVKRKWVTWRKGTLLPWEIIVALGPVGYEYIWVWYLIKGKEVYWLCLKIFLLPHVFVIATIVTYHVSFLMALRLMLNPATMNFLVEVIPSQWIFNY